MFNWCQNATDCYVYLVDVDSTQYLMTSRWFTRGWTLQELLAPDSAIFFNNEWREVGTKSSLAEQISIVTKIPTQVLLRKEGGDLVNFSVAQIMSWDSDRQTTRVEDMGHCLLGIFGVNMPMRL